MYNIFPSIKFPASFLHHFANKNYIGSLKGIYQQSTEVRPIFSAIAYCVETSYHAEPTWFTYNL